MDEQDDKTLYTVVTNRANQFSLWYANREPPPGWRETEKRGTKRECLDYIEAKSDRRTASDRQQPTQAS